MKFFPSCFFLLAAFIISPAPTARADTTLFQQLGGEAGIARIVDHFISLASTDKRVKEDFDNINLDRLNGSVRMQLCVLAGGPCQYKGRTMAASHKGLDITQAQFNAVAEDMQTAMDQSGIPYWTQNRLMALLAPMQRDIVTK